MFFLYPDMTVAERETVLLNQCAKKEMRNYSRSLADSEVSNERTRLADDIVEKKKLEEALANLAKEYKSKIKNIDDRVDERLAKITTRKATISGQLYGMANQQQGRMMFYDKYGELVDSRELLPEEKQGALFAIAGTNEALKDLPLETANVIREITDEQEQKEEQVGAGEQALGENRNENIEEAHVIPEGEPAQQEAKIQPWAPTDQKTLANFTHDEDGWEKMSDAQLMQKYGSVDISLIRTMKLIKGKWQYPKGETKGKIDRLKGETNQEDEQK